MTLLPAPHATRRKVVVLRDMHELEPEQPVAREDAEPAHSSASDHCTVPTLKPRRRPTPTEPSLLSAGTDCATTSAVKGFGDSSGVPAPRKRTAEQALDAVIGEQRDGSESSPQRDGSESSPQRGAPRARHDITWLMALHDASNPLLPAPDLHKVLPTSYAGDEQGDNESSHKSSKSVDDAGPSASLHIKKASSLECNYVSGMLHTLYHGPSCNISTSLTFVSIVDEAAYYVFAAKCWMRRHATALTVMCMLTTLAVAHTSLPAHAGQCAWLQSAPSNTRTVLLAIADAVLVVVATAGGVVATLLGMPEKPNEVLLLLPLGTWRWIAMHLVLQLLVCAPMHLLSLLPKARRLQLLEPVTQVRVFLAPFLNMNWLHCCTHDGCFFVFGYFAWSRHVIFRGHTLRCLSSTLGVPFRRAFQGACSAPTWSPRPSCSAAIGATCSCFPRAGAARAGRRPSCSRL